MKTLLARIMGLAIVVVANPASAYVVAITTSIPATSVADDTDLKAALVSAIENVFNLAKVEDFSGNCAAVSVGATVGGGGGATLLRNQHGVGIELLSTTQGASVMVGVEGIRLTLVN